MTAPIFRRRFLDSLPGDEDTAPRAREVLGACWSRVQPTPVAQPAMLHWSPQLAAELGLDAARMDDGETAQVLAGNAQWPGMAPYAANYGGHQFGHWAGQLGDGRAIVLGELERPDGATAELQLKGAGPTAYSRAGDGREYEYSGSDVPGEGEQKIMARLREGDEAAACVYGLDADLVLL